MSQSLKIGVVGACGSGKTTLKKGLQKHGIDIRQIAQEHSYVPDMWQRLSNPDVLIFLEVSYPITMKRKPFYWQDADYQEQIHRLRHAYENADLHVDTDHLSPDEVLENVLAFIKSLSI